MTFLHEGHDSCLHVCLMPGVVYCYDAEAIFVEVQPYIKYLERGDYRVLPATCFVEACLRGRYLIGRAPFRAYVWLSPDTEFRGLKHTHHTMRDVFKRMEESKP